MSAGGEGRPRRAGIGRAFDFPASPARVGAEVDEELQFHIDTRIEELVARGADPAAARATALREFGDVSSVAAECRELTAPVARRRRRADALGATVQDVAFAARTLRRTPGYSVVAVLTLALGIGLTAAVYSVVRGVLFRPLPYPAPERLVRLYERTPTSDRVSFAGANAIDVQSATHTLAGVAYVSAYPETVLGAGEARRARVAGASRNFFDVMGVPAAAGRTVAVGEGALGGPQVAVVSSRFWESALGGDPNFVARTLRIGGGTYPIVGVMPPAFDYPLRTDVWVTNPDDLPSRTAHNWAVVGRLAPGATIEGARAEVDGILARLKRQNGTQMDAIGVTLNDLHTELARRARTLVLMLSGAVALVLLVACVNLASANLARAESRRREFALRAALGAGRGRLVRQLVTENVALGLVGGALGVGLAYVVTRALVRLAPTAIPGYADVRLDPRVLGFVVALSVATGLVIGLAPAWQVARSLRGAIAEGAQAGVGGGRLRARAALVGAEVALALVLLAGAGLLVRSMHALLGTNPGFRTDRAISVNVSLPSANYGDTLRTAAFYDRLLPALRAIPGVTAAGVVSALPLSGEGSNTGFMFDGGAEIAGDADYRVTDSAYFGAVGIPLRAGRSFTRDDRPGAPHVALVNETFARKYGRADGIIGHRVRPPGMDGHGDVWLTVVGVVGDVRGDALEAPAYPAIFVDYAQRPENLRGGATFVLASSLPLDRVASAVRARVKEVDGDVPVSLSTLDALVARSVADRRFTMTVLALFAACALGLAALGVYGVLAYSVAQRRREIGVRMALGAQRGTVRAMIIGDAMRAVVPGLAVGVVGALAASRLLGGMLYEVSPTDPATLATVCAVLAATALAASWVPASRATRVDPLVAIRSE